MYKTGSPPPIGSKKVVFRFRSVSSIVIPAASTGRESTSKIAVISTDHTNSGMRSTRSPFVRMLITVEMKFTAPKIDDTPAKCREKMARSTDGPLWAMLPANGGYTVHPVPTPFSTAALERSRVSDGGRSQNLILFRRGKAMSGAPSIRGTSQFPNPPIITGITKKKIITKAWAVTIVL